MKKLSLKVKKEIFKEYYDNSLSIYDIAKKYKTDICTIDSIREHPEIYGVIKTIKKEKEIEEKLNKYVKDRKGLSLKFKSSNNIGVMDRICLLPIQKRHINIVNKYIKFVELKKPGGKPRKTQLKKHREFNDLGFKTYVVDNEDYIKKII